MIDDIYQIFNPAPVNKSKVIIACIGDSITYGFGVSDKRNTASYPALLQKELGTDYQVLNYGLNGRTVRNSGDRPYRKELFYKKSLSAEADLYIIMLGTNDTKPYNWDKNSFEIELEELVKTYRNHSKKCKVILMQPPTCYPDPEFGEVLYDISETLIREEVYQIVKKVGDRLETQVIDLYHLTEQHADWFMDGVHPNEEGNRNIAHYIRIKILESDH